MVQTEGVAMGKLALCHTQAGIAKADIKKWHKHNSRLIFCSHVVSGANGGQRQAELEHVRVSKKRVLAHVPGKIRIIWK